MSPTQGAQKVLLIARHLDECASVYSQEMSKSTTQTGERETNPNDFRSKYPSVTE